MVKVLLAVDGPKHIGAATAYLIECARRAAVKELIITCVNKSGHVSSQYNQYNLTFSNTCNDYVPAMLDAAGPWLDNVGISYEFRNADAFEDIADVVIRISNQERCDEVVLVSSSVNILSSVISRYTRIWRSPSYDRIVSGTKVPVTFVESPTEARDDDRDLSRRRSRKK